MFGFLHFLSLHPTNFDLENSRFLVVANGLAAAYSLVQALRCVVSMVRGSVLFSKPLAWVIFSSNQVLPRKKKRTCHFSPHGNRIIYANSDTVALLKKIKT